MAEQTVTGLSSRDLRGIMAAIAAITAVGISLSLGLPLLSVVLSERGVPTSWIGINTAVSGLAAILITPFVTPLAKRVGTAQLLICVILIGAVVFMAFYFVQPFWAWFPLRFVFHACLAAAFVLSEFWINALAPPAKRGLIMGIYATVLASGFAIGPLVLSQTGFSGPEPFLAGMTLFLLAAIPVMFAIRSSPVIDGHGRTSIWPFLLAAPMATLAAMVFGAVESGGFAIATLYGIELGFSEAASAGLITAIALGNLFSQIPLGLLADRMNKRTL
ncbi:MAG: MFS transporter, partial [Pseudomonadota bacterium]